MTPRIAIPQDQIAEFCKRWKITEFALFGSVLREDFRPDSDVDVLVSFSPDARWGLLAMSRMERELETLFGREVDLVTRPSVERSENYIRKRHVLQNLAPVYVAG